jgi:hypothetical protein
MIYLIVAVLTLTAALHADTLELKTGEKVEGTFKQAGAAGAVIEVGGQPITFALDKVRAIYLGSGPSQQGNRPITGVTDALDALKGLRSLTQGGIALRDYTARVADARIRVGRYLDGATASPNKEAVGAAMELYEYAARLWPNDLLNATSVFIEIEKKPELLNCPSMQSAMAEVDRRAFEKTGKHPPENLRVSALGLGDTGRPQFLWKCASEMLDKIVIQ